MMATHRSFPKGLLFLLFLLASLPVVAADLEITINEGGKIISFYDQYYIYQLNGTVVFHNPSNYTLFNIQLPLYLSTLDVRANFSSADYFMNSNEIYLYSIGPDETRAFNYRLVGISSEDLSSDNTSVLRNAILAFQPKVYSNVFGTLKKAPIEDPAYTGRSNARLISVEFSNPTSFDYHINMVEVIKTLDMDPNAEVDRWSFTGQKTSLAAGEGWSFDFIDENASEGEIYWLNADIYIDRIHINASANITRNDQDDLFLIVSNATLNESVNDSLALLSDRIYLRKMVSSTLVTPGDLVNVTVLVNNLEPKDIHVTVTDPYPAGFEPVTITDGVFDGSNATWNISLSSGNAKRLRYTLRYTDPDSLGVDYFRPAQLIYGDDIYYSQSVPFVRKYVPEKRLFVQKNVKFLAGDEVQVQLKLQNLGESTLQNVVVKEHLLSTAEFREISQQPMERGLWRVESLNHSQSWEVTYITDRASVLNTMPEVYGVPQSSVMQTIILSNLITSRFKTIPTSVVEVAGIIILGIILLLYFIPPSYLSRVKRRQVRNLHLMSRELSSLRDQTDRHNQTLAEELHAPVQPPAQPMQQPSAEAHRLVQHSGLHSPERLARHQAMDESAEKLKDAKSQITDADTK